MTDKLTDDRIAAWAEQGHPLAREVQAWRRLANGGQDDVGIVARLASAEARLIGAVHHADIDMALREVQHVLAQLREIAS